MNPEDASLQEHSSSIPLLQDPAVPKRGFAGLFPGGQFVRYLCVGVFNSVFGYATSVLALTLLNTVHPEQLLSLKTVLASILSTPLNITVAYFGYKFLVFRTKGNYLREWLKCFAVYGTSMIPGLVALAALTRLLQTVIHRHAASLHASLNAVEGHLSGKPQALLQHVATGRAMAGYIAIAMVMGVTTIYSFIGHKKVTFAAKAA